MRYIWASPATCVGFLLAVLAFRGGRVRFVDGTLEACGPWLRWVLAHCVPLPGGAAAMTLGHVIIGRDDRSLDVSRAHERIHVRQYERWGPLFLPAYVIASLWAAASGAYYYADNMFEREAVAGRTRSRTTVSFPNSSSCH
jgi:hypothetical protein